jgi:D-alanyl-lipoteichoic acid acyltransferase DltB (MBOAT superfamily)
MNVFGWKVDSVTLHIILPVGISFYTFQTLSYTIDIYRRNFVPTTNLVSFFTYVSLFPQLVAGPIERASNLLPQIEKERSFSLPYFKDGIIQISIGLFRKIVIADNLGVFVDTIYGSPMAHHSTSLLLGTVLYAFQIYYDFAGYSDIAIGSAKLLGFRFNQNFNFPYFSNSITQFWRNWHISLSSWLRDYLYISLGGNRKGIRITYRNLMLTMLLGGLWHGSDWNFVIWGGIHGIALSIEKLVFSLTGKKSPGWLGYLYVFPVTLISWVFFRATDFESSIYILRTIFQFDIQAPFIGNTYVFFNGLSMLLLGLVFDLFIKISRIPLENLGRRLNLHQLVFFSVLIAMLIALFYSTSENFIYFQF